jgi:hypothetical protein
MASFVKFFDFTEQLLSAKHNFTAAGDIFKVYATNATPDQTADAFKADLAEITPQNGYPSGGSDIQNTLSETGGTATVGGTDVVWTASGGSFGPLAHVALYNDTMTTPSPDGLVGYWSYGSSISVLSGETLTIDFSAAVLTVV